MDSSKYLVILLSLILPASVYSARILALEPFPSKSHMVVFSSLTRELARRGHELVVVSAFPNSKPIANYTDIDFMPFVIAEQGNTSVSCQLYELSKKSVLQYPPTVWQMGLCNDHRQKPGSVTPAIASERPFIRTLSATKRFLKVPQVQHLLNDKRGFDLVIVEAFVNEAIYAFADYFKVPLVLVSPFGGYHVLNYGTKNPNPLSYVPTPILNYSDRMNFVQRLTNVAYTVLYDLGYYLYYLPRQEAIRKEVFGEKGIDIWSLESYASLILLNNHFSMTYPRPMVPNMIQVGGMHVSYNTCHTLPDDLQKFLDEAVHGVIYFSMGSNLRSDDLPVEKRDAILAAFSELPQRVLWKWESDNLIIGKPDNVKLGKWMPQQDILAHPKIRLFITHGGLLSAQEAIYQGVPLLGIPMFGDQPMNMRKAELDGYGLVLQFKNVTKQSMLWAINNMLDNPRYRMEAKRRSEIFRDQPESPLEQAVFWTEYVIRHKGAPHLRTTANQLSWYQLHLIDVTAFILTIFTVIVFLVKGIFKIFYLWCCTSSTNEKSSKVKKNK